MREHPLPGWSGPTVLALVIGAAGVGNALGSVIGNRRGGPEPERLATGVAALAVVATLLTAVLYSLPTLVLLGLATGLYGQLAKLSLDALIQRDVDDHVRARVFSWSETILQACWVVGGGLGIIVPAAARARLRPRHRPRRRGGPASPCARAGSGTRPPVGGPRQPTRRGQRRATGGSTVRQAVPRPDRACSYSAA